MWAGRELAGRGFAMGPGDYRAPPCTPDSCDLIPFRVDVPDGSWAANPGAVEVSIEWEHQESDYESVTTDTVPMGHYLSIPNVFMHLRVLDKDGKLVADGVDGYHYASLVLIEDLPAGEYVAEVHALYGKASYVGVVQVEPRAAPLVGELLPDLMIMTPSELTLEHPIGREAPDPLMPLGRTGCDPDEAIEFGAVRCLRFATGFGNLGPGPLELHLSMDEVQKGIAGEGQWQQRLYAADGSFRDVPASSASYHKVHGHYHILGLDVTTVYAYDLATGVRGEPAGEGHKTGFCPADSALIEPEGLGTTYPVSYPGCCQMWGFCQQDLVNEGELQIGLSPGWYDVYPWWRADQYVDIAGAEDGVYELETCANPEGKMMEARVDNNCASVLFRLTGNEIEVLGSGS